MSFPVTSILIGLDITQEFGLRLKSQTPEGHIYVQGCPGRYGITCSLFQKFFLIPRQCRKVWNTCSHLLKFFLIHRQCLTGVLKSESGALPVTSILIGLNITHDFGSKLKSQPLKVTFMSQGDQKGMEIPADCSISVL